ncbi:MAG: GNAT family N-acetyltransferase [Armatimonadetes bacterium]|nr:GNAT family N-acetyltransferase [Anaerolineae bacterium]
MTATFIIRDGLASDLSACLALDHTYETDYVWQMSLTPEGGGWQVLFKKERLPRTLQTAYDASEHRLRATVPPDHCFLVAGERDSDVLYGYLSMRYEPSRRVGWIQDVMVDRAYRRAGVASRLMRVARTWAIERGITRLMVETQTRNVPSIGFCTALGFAFCGYNDRYLDQQDIAVFFGQSLGQSAR